MGRFGTLMDRRSEVLKHVSKEARGIEIGPYFSPLAPKREGYNCLSLDVFDTETVRRRARSDVTLPKESIDLIEPIDLVGSALLIDELALEKGETAPFDYVVSSHNFEHLPNPIKFLQACGRVLKTDGVLSMAVPDKRACFDYFRPRTSLTAWIEAYMEGRERPSHAQAFEQDGLISKYVEGERALISFTLDESRQNVVPEQKLREAFADWVRRRKANDKVYYDVHCSAFTPSSFRLLLSDAFFLGLSPFAVEEVTHTAQSEFYAHLRHVGYKRFTEEETQAHYAERRKTLHAVVSEEAGVAARESAFQIFEHMAQRYRHVGKSGVATMARALWLLLRSRDARLFRHYLAIANSVFFDPTFYADAHGEKGDAALHYLMEGARDGLDPGPFFSTRNYLIQNFDVAKTGMNPLAHYELFGRAEGRKPALR